LNRFCKIVFLRQVYRRPKAEKEQHELIGTATRISNIVVYDKNPHSHADGLIPTGLAMRVIINM